MKPAHISFWHWLHRVLGWDGLLPLCIFILPHAIEFCLPNAVEVQNILTAVVPCAALYIRFTVGRQHIAANCVSPILRTCQYCAFIVAIFWLCFLEFVVILIGVIAVAPAAGTWDVLAVMYIPYLLAMVFAMFPGWSVTLPAETSEGPQPSDVEASG